MQVCPKCGRVYDESEDSSCPYCCDYDPRPIYHIVIGDNGEALSLAGEDYEEFKKNHPEYN